MFCNICYVDSVCDSHFLEENSKTEKIVCTLLRIKTLELLSMFSFFQNTEQLILPGPMVMVYGYANCKRVKF